VSALEVARKGPAIAPADVDVLRALGYDPARVESRALLLIAKHYDLDPLLRQVMLLPIKGVLTPYVTRDGMVQIAHRSGQLDGMVCDELRRGEHGFSCTFSVWRKDMQHPFTYRGGCGHQEFIAKNGFGAEMALARAERRSLIRAFAMGTPDDVPDAEVEAGPRVDPDLIEPEVVEELSVPAADGHDHDPTAVGTDPEPLELTQNEAHRVVGAPVPAQRAEFLARHKIAEFGEPWPPVALEDAARIAQEPF